MPDVSDAAIFEEYLATGDSYAAIARRRNLSARKVGQIVREGQAAFAQVIRGEFAQSDPRRLFPGGTFTPYNPSALVTRKGMSIFDQMRQDEQVKAALGLKKHTVLSSGWEIVADVDDPQDWAPRRFVDHALTQHLETPLADTLLEVLTALDFGFSVTEKVYEAIDHGEWKGMIGLKALKPKKPHYFDFDTDEFGNLKPNGLLQNDLGHTGAAPTRNLPPGKFLIFHHQREFSNWYGRSDLESCYRPWWMKDNAYRWLAMFLERWGTAPVFGLYNQQAYTGAHVDKLQTVLERLQAGTAGVIPRANKDDLELWTPQITAHAKDVFIPALNRFDTDIAKSLLVPSLLGVTPEGSTGSQARAQTQFDVFMLVVDHIRDRLVEAFNKQVIQPLVDINFPGEIGDDEQYPYLQFFPLTEDIKKDVLDTWATLTREKAVHPLPKDEVHVRELLGFPDASEEEIASAIEAGKPPLLPSAPDGNSGGGNPPEPDAGPDDDDKEAMQRQFTVEFSREPNQWEKHVDFKAINATLNDIEDRTIQTIAGHLAKVRDSLVAHVQKHFDGTAKWVAGLSGLQKMPAVREAIGAFLVETFERGQDSVKAELPQQRSMEEEPNFVPRDALKFFEGKKLWIAGVIEERLLSEAKAVLFRAIETGELRRVTESKLNDIFAPYAGSAVTDPWRLETIVRTNSTEAFNKGRLVSSRRAGSLLTGFEYSAIIDSRTTEVCRHLDGKFFQPNDPTLDSLSPPRHFACRSLLVPVTVGEDIPEFINEAEIGKARELSGKGFV